MPKHYSSDSDANLSDSDYLSGSDMDIDPDLPTAKAPTEEYNLDSFDDADFPEPVVFSDDEGLGHDDLDDGYTLRDNIKAALGFRVRGKLKLAMKRRLMRHSDKANDPEVRHNLALANEAFVKLDLSTAWEHYKEVIKLDPRNFNAYRTMGEICQMRGNMNKCCSYWVLAASCGEADAEFWGMVAELSAELGHVDQAIHCYNNAIAKLEGKNPHHILERALLYKQKKQFGRALEGFQRVHQVFPEDSSIIRHLASVYMEQKRLNDAVNLYMRILDNNMHPQPNTKYPKFNWSALNITCELFISQHSWSPGIRLIKVVSRWKQGRQDEETLWDDNDDSEFDEVRRRKALYTKKPASHAAYMERDFDLPIDIRFKLGQFRLELDQKDEALIHFGFLFKEKREEVKDLFYEAGRGLEAKGHYEDAVHFLNNLFTVEENPELGFLLGKCYLEFSDYENAKNVLLNVLVLDPNNVDMKLTLIEALYHTGDMNKAAELMEDISKTQVTRRIEPQGEQDDVDMEEDQDENLALIKNSAYYKNVRSKLMTDEERKEIEDNAIRLVTNKFNRMQRLQEPIDKGHRVAASAWMKLAAQLIEMFMEVRSFFPKNRKTTFKGIVMYKRKKSISLDDKLARLYNLYEGITESDNSRMELTSQNEFRGLSYDVWLYIFVQYAFLLRIFDNNLEEAVQVLDVALDVSVFIQDKTKSMLLRMARLSLGIAQEEYATTVSNNVRYLLTSTQFSPTTYDFFMCCFASGVGAWAAFSNYNHQKYFLRHLKAYDSLLTSSKVSGSAQVTIDVKDFNFTREHPQLLYIYACLLGSNRTFSSPIVYLTRAYRQYYNDPTICFMLGLAHVHRSMQRNTNNRHIQLLQGISYLMEYKEAREKNATVYEKQEIEYNFGRLFHMIGLTTLAVKHYNKVLEFHDELKNDQDYDMLIEAAYNLNLIYTIDGNSEMAERILDQYLTI